MLAEWIEPYRVLWTERLDALEGHLRASSGGASGVDEDADQERRAETRGKGAEGNESLGTTEGDHE